MAKPEQGKARRAETIEKRKGNSWALQILSLLIFTVYPNQEVFPNEKSELMILNKLIHGHTWNIFAETGLNLVLLTQSAGFNPLLFYFTWEKSFPKACLHLGCLTDECTGIMTVCLLFPFSHLQFLTRICDYSSLEENGYRCMKKMNSEKC